MNPSRSILVSQVRHASCMSQIYPFGTKARAVNFATNTLNHLPPPPLPPKPVLSQTAARKAVLQGTKVSTATGVADMAKRVRLPVLKMAAMARTPKQPEASILASRAPSASVRTSISDEPLLKEQNEALMKRVEELERSIKSMTTKKGKAVRK